MSDKLEAKKFLNNYKCTFGEKYCSGMCLQRDEVEKMLTEFSSAQSKKDSDLLDWLQKIMTGKDNYCEVYFAGLRSGHSDATSFQIESNPEKFDVQNAPTIREAILLAISAYGEI